MGGKADVAVIVDSRHISNLFKVNLSLALPNDMRVGMKNQRPIDNMHQCNKTND